MNPSNNLDKIQLGPCLNVEFEFFSVSKQCLCDRDSVKINMDVFIKKFQVKVLNYTLGLVIMNLKKTCDC